MTEHSWRNLFVAKLPRSITDADLYEIFRDLNPISAKVMLEATTGKSKGFGFVLFESESAGHEAYKALSKTPVTSHGQKFHLCIFASKHDGTVAMETNKALYIRNIPITLTPENVQTVLGTLGHLTYCAMREDHHGSPVWVVYAEYATVEEAKRVLEKLHGNKTFFKSSIAVLAKFADTEETKRDRRQRHQLNSHNQSARNYNVNNYHHCGHPRNVVHTSGDVNSPGAGVRGVDTYNTHMYNDNNSNNNMATMCNYSPHKLDLSSYPAARAQNMPYPSMHSPTVDNYSKFAHMHYAEQGNNMASRNNYPMNTNGICNRSNVYNYCDSKWNSICHQAAHNANYHYNNNSNYISMNEQLNMQQAPDIPMPQYPYYPNSQIVHGTPTAMMSPRMMGTPEIYDTGARIQNICDNSCHYYSNASSCNCEDTSNNNTCYNDTYSRPVCVRYDEPDNSKVHGYTYPSPNNGQVCPQDHSSSLCLSSSRKQRGKGSTYRHNPYALSLSNSDMPAVKDCNVELSSPSLCCGVTPCASHTKNHSETPMDDSVQVSPTVHVARRPGYALNNHDQAFDAYPDSSHNACQANMQDEKAS